MAPTPSHEPIPLTPSLAPTGGEDVRRTGKGDSHWFKGHEQVLSEQEALQGRLIGFSEQMAKALGLVEILIEFDDPAKRFALGSFLEATAVLEKTEMAITVPTSALLRTAEGDCAYVVNEKYLFRTPVTIGAVDGGFVEIKDGLYAGDQVASHPVMSLWLAELAAVKGGQSCCLTKPIAP